MNVFKHYFINADLLNFRSKFSFGLVWCKDIQVKFITEPSWQDPSLGHSEAVLLSYSFSVSWKSSDPSLWYQSICFLQHHTSPLPTRSVIMNLYFFFFLHVFFRILNLTFCSPHPELNTFDFGFKLIFHLLNSNDFWIFSDENTGLFYFILDHTLEG